MDFADAPILRTERLTLRGWREEDLAPFAALNADPEVVEFLPRALSRQQSDALAAGVQDSFRARGYGWWALEVSHTGRFAGFVGLNVPRFEAAFTPCVETGWRLDRGAWGQGYATEAASAVLAYAFEAVGLVEIVAFTAQDNLRSRAVMQRLGMTHDPADDFLHPALPAGHRLRQHVLYRLAALSW